MVSIGMPVYNGARYIRDALDSVLRQSFQDYELIISDNASDDDTKAICDEYSSRFPQMRYIRQQRNIGGHRNFTFVAQQARGQFITWLAHDDVLEPEFLQQTVGYLLATPRAVLAATDFTVIDEHGERVEAVKLTTIRPEIPWGKRVVEFFEHPGANVFFCIYGLMRADICKTVLQSLREPRLASGSELPVLARMAASGEIAALPGLLRNYRQHVASVYMQEEKGIAGAPFLRRLAIRTANIYGLRFDQMKVLWGCSWSFRFKCITTIRVLAFYVTLLASRAQRVLAIVLGRAERK